MANGNAGAAPRKPSSVLDKSQWKVGVDGVECFEADGPTGILQGHVEGDDDKLKPAEGEIDTESWLGRLFHGAVEGEVEETTATKGKSKARRRKEAALKVEAERAAALGDGKRRRSKGSNRSPKQRTSGFFSKMMKNMNSFFSNK